MKYIWMQSSLISGSFICRRLKPGKGRKTTRIRELQVTDEASLVIFIPTTFIKCPTHPPLCHLHPKM